MTEKFYERHAWILPFGLGVVSLLSALGFVVMGQPFEEDLVRVTGRTWREITALTPGLDTLIGLEYRALGLAYVGFALLVVAISVKSFRRGERWAWLVLWYYPIVFGLIAVLDFGFGGAFWPIATIQTVLFVIGLLLPVRKFFPKR